MTPRIYDLVFELSEREKEKDIEIQLKKEKMDKLKNASLYGNLNYQSHTLQMWTPYFVIFEKNVLSFYKNNRELKPYFEIHTNGCKVKPATNDAMKNIKGAFYIDDGAVTHVVSAPSKEKMLEWVSKIRESSDQ